MKMITVCIYSTIQLPFWQGLSAQRRCPGRSAMSEKPRLRHRWLYHKHSLYRLAKYQSAPSVHKETHVTTIQIISAIVFGLALIHTFAAKSFEPLAQRHPRHGGLLHLLGEVEVVFGFWAFILIIIMAFVSGGYAAIEYAESRQYTEPLFVFVVMVVAASRPVLDAVQRLLKGVARVMPLRTELALVWLGLALVPLTGSLITEPAAMTLAALMLAPQIFRPGIPEWLKYGALGVLFVNVSIGGTLTSYAAPP